MSPLLAVLLLAASAYSQDINADHAVNAGGSGLGTGKADKAATANPELQREREARAQRRMLVTFADGAGFVERAQALAKLGFRLSDDFAPLGMSVLELDAPVTAKDRAAARAASGVVEVEQDSYRPWLAQAKPAPAARCASARSGEVQWGVERVQAPAAWAHGAGKGVVVAVLDTGVDCSHRELRCVEGGNLVDRALPPADDNGHGTHVAGIIAAARDGAGVVGVAPEALVMPVKVLDETGSGAISEIVAGIYLAANDPKVRVINMSLGSTQNSAALRKAVAWAQSRGVVIVAAAGNQGGSRLDYPAAYAGVLAVGANDACDRIASFSNTGPLISFMAPGVDVQSTSLNGGFSTMSGTSMATPHVSGLAALAIERGARGSAGVRAALLRAASARRIDARRL